MKLALLVALVVVAGMLQPVQQGMNAALGRHLGRAALGAVWNFTLGLLAMLVLALVVLRAPIPSAGQLASAPKWALWGGLCGGTIVLAFILGARPLGAALTVSLFIVGQLAASVVIDHFGWLGFETKPLGPARLAGVVLLLAGVVLVEYGGRRPGAAAGTTTTAAAPGGRGVGSAPR